MAVICPISAVYSLSAFSLTASSLTSSFLGKSYVSANVASMHGILATSTIQYRSRLSLLTLNKVQKRLPLILQPTSKQKTNVPVMKAVMAASTLVGMIWVKSTYIGRADRDWSACVAMKKFTEFNKMSESVAPPKETLLPNTLLFRRNALQSTSRFEIK